MELFGGPPEVGNTLFSYCFRLKTVPGGSPKGCPKGTLLGVFLVSFGVTFCPPIWLRNSLFCLGPGCQMQAQNGPQCRQKDSKKEPQKHPRRSPKSALQSTRKCPQKSPLWVPFGGPWGALLGAPLGDFLAPVGAAQILRKRCFSLGK